MVEKIICLKNLNIQIFNFFFFFQHLRKRSTETYGSFRVEFLHDEDGEILKENDLFFNLYDLWTVTHSGFLLETYELKIVKLKKIIKKNGGERKTYQVLKCYYKK